MNSATAAPRLDLHLAAYLVAREADSRPVTPRELDALRRTNASCAETRERLIHGRSNVREEVRATAHANARLNQARREVEKQTGFHRRSADHAAGLVAYAGVGNCGEHAEVGLYLHATRLRPGESVQLGRNRGVDHEFAIHENQTGPAAPSVRVMLDPWGVDPAVNLVDVKQNKLLISNRRAITTNNAPARVKAFAEGVVTGPRYDREIQRRKAELEAKNFRVSRWSLWDNPSQIRQGFAKRAQRALDAVPLPDGKPMPTTGKRGALARVHLDAKALLHVRNCRDIKAQMPQLTAQRDARNAEWARQAAVALGADDRTAADAAGDIVSRAKNLRAGVPQPKPQNAQHWQGGNAQLPDSVAVFLSKQAQA